MERRAEIQGAGDDAGYSPRALREFEDGYADESDDALEGLLDGVSLQEWLRRAEG